MFGKQKNKFEINKINSLLLAIEKNKKHQTK